MMVEERKDGSPKGRDPLVSRARYTTAAPEGIRPTAERWIITEPRADPLIEA
jgi:hypothetical protein